MPSLNFEWETVLAWRVMSGAWGGRLALKYVFQKMSLQLTFSPLIHPGPFLCWELASPSKEGVSMHIDQSAPLGLPGATEINRMSLLVL